MEPENKKLFDKLIDESKFILNLEDNWDDEGALKIEYDTYRNVELFLEWYFKEYLYSNIPIPEINPCHDGSIDLSWRSDKGRLLINFKPDNTVSFYGDNLEETQSIKGKSYSHKCSKFLIIWIEIYI